MSGPRHGQRHGLDRPGTGVPSVAKHCHVCLLAARSDQSKALEIQAFAVINDTILAINTPFRANYAESKPGASVYGVDKPS